MNLLKYNIIIYMYKHLKLTCKKFEECADIDVIKTVETWYGKNNIPLLENTGNISENIKKYKDKLIQNTTTIKAFRGMNNTIIKIINTIFRSNVILHKDNANEKYQLYNISSLYTYYIPFIYLSVTLTYFNNFKSLTDLKDNNIIKNWGNTYIYIFLIYSIISLIIIIIGLYKIFKCLNDTISKYYIYLGIYAIIYIIINNIFIPLLIENLKFEGIVKKIGVMIGITIVTLIFIIMTVIYYIKERILDDKLLIEDSLYFSLYNKYIKNIIKMITTILLLSSIIINISSKGFEFVNTIGMGILYCVYAFIFYINIYGIIENNNYDKIGIYSILFIILFFIFIIFVIYEMVNNLEKVCIKINNKDKLTDKDKDRLNPIKNISTIIVSSILIVLFFYLFGKIYNNDNWDFYKYNFFISYALYFIITLTSPLYTIKYSTSIHYVLLIIVSIIQIRWIWVFIKTIYCFIISIFKSLV